MVIVPTLLRVRVPRFLRGRYEAGAPVDALPLNDTLTQLPAAIATAHRLYGAPAAVVLFVVQAGETNVMDQRLLEFALWDSHAIPVVRLSLLEVRFFLPRWVVRAC